MTTLSADRALEPGRIDALDDCSIDRPGQVTKGKRQRLGRVESIDFELGAGAPESDK